MHCLVLQAVKNCDKNKFAKCSRFLPPKYVQLLCSFCIFYLALRFFVLLGSENSPKLHRYIFITTITFWMYVLYTLILRFYAFITSLCKFYDSYSLTFQGYITMLRCVISSNSYFKQFLILLFSTSQNNSL